MFMSLGDRKIVGVSSTMRINTNEISVGLRIMASSILTFSSDLKAPGFGADILERTALGF